MWHPHRRERHREFRTRSNNVFRIGNRLSELILLKEGHRPRSPNGKALDLLPLLIGPRRLGWRRSAFVRRRWPVLEPGAGSGHAVQGRHHRAHPRSHPHAGRRRHGSLEGFRMPGQRLRARHLVGIKRLESLS